MMHGSYGAPAHYAIPPIVMVRQIRLGSLLPGSLLTISRVLEDIRVLETITAVVAARITRNSLAS